MNERELLKRSLRQMYLLIASSLVAMLGVSIYNFGMSFFILSTTGSAKLFSFNLAIGVIGRIIVAPLSGYLADNFGRKKVIFVALFSEAVVVLLLLLYIHFFSFHIIALYIATALSSMISSLSTPSFMAAIPSIVHPDHLQKTMGYNSTGSSLSMLLGPVIGGLMFGFVSKEIFILFFVIAYMTAALLVLLIDFNLFKAESVLEQPQESVIENFVNGVKYLNNNDVLKSMMLLFMALNFFMSSLNIGMSKVIVGHFKASSQMMGFLEASLSVGVLIGGIVIGSQKKFASPFPVLKKALLINAVALIIISIPLFVPNTFWPVYIVLMAMCLITGISMQYINTPIFVFFQEKIEAHMMGRVFSVIGLISQLLMPISYIVFGIVFDLGYYSWTFLICGVSCIALVLMILNNKFYAKANTYGVDKE